MSLIPARLGFVIIGHEDGQALVRFATNFVS